MSLPQTDYFDANLPGASQTVRIASLFLDHWWQTKLDAQAPFDDGYVDIGGFRERRTRYGFTKHWRDPDWNVR